MMRTLVNVNPLNELRAMDEVLERLFTHPARPVSNVGGLPVDIIERDNKLVIRAAVPGVAPEAIDISVENNVLTIRGESKDESSTENDKVYRREVSYGAFARSIRLPENMDLNAIDAEFKQGFVTISIPRIVEEAPQPIKIAVRNGDLTN
jgi:HSP20 family protein